MLVTCWSVKGGSGTTVVAAALALLLARRSPSGALLVDVGGDLPAALGIPEPSGPGLTDWLGADADLAPDALSRLEIDVGSGLGLLPRGPGSRPPAAGDGERLLTVLGTGTSHLPPSGAGEDRRPVVIDAGPASAVALELAAGATVSLLVLRPCYLALRRALAAPLRPSAVVLVDERQRALDAVDVEEVLGVPVRAVVPYDPAIARCVDAGLLGARIPRRLVTALRRAA